jgi:hypothetical protein
MGFGYWLADFTHRFEVSGQGVLEVAARVFRRIAGGGATGNVR